MARETRYTDKPGLLVRLRKMEGQLRGIERMIEDDRYCLDVVQQVNAVTAGLRELSLRVLEDHLEAVVAESAKGGEHGQDAVKEMMAILRRTLRP